jgi:hypothetical protein
MKIDYMKWHEGVGYDLEALRALSPEERSRVEDILTAHPCEDWRDVEALAELGSQKAQSALQNAINSSNYEVRIAATERLAKSGNISEGDVEKILIETIPAVTILNGQTSTLRLAENYPTPAVRQILLWCSLNGNDDIRVHAAALIYYLYGIAKTSFDWNFRAFYLRFGEKTFARRKLAFLEMCDTIHVDPKWANGEK